MKPYLEERRIPPALHGDVLKLLIDAFASAVDQVAAEPRGAGRIVRVETRDAVKGEWKDEIHPSTKGAQRVAKRFEQALRAAGVIG